MEEINSLKTDKLDGMTFCERYVAALGHQIQTIFWLKEDANGHHWFEVSYIEKKKGGRNTSS